MAGLVELDSVEILAIIDNELDPISPNPNPTTFTQSGSVKDIALHESCLVNDNRGSNVYELRMGNICCSAHGLSLLITGVKGDQRHTLLFDAGPEGEAWERNATRLRVDAGKIETVVLSHWHRDHSGGLLKAFQMMKMATGQAYKPIDIDLHPARPDCRGVRPPNSSVVCLEPDPTFAEIEEAGGALKKNDQTHTVLDDMFLVTGEIPRVTDYELGFRFGVRFDAGSKSWSTDEKMADERMLLVKLKGKGLVMITGCGHAGIVNSARYAKELGQGLPLYAIIGGFHLADAQPGLIQQTVRDLKQLDVQLVLPGHCTGWRAKFEIHNQMPGRMAPCFVGSKFVL